MTHFLVSDENPDGYKLEDILIALRKDVIHRCSKIADDRRSEAQHVLSNNIHILELMSEAIEIIRRKGYRSFVGHVQEHLIPYWKRYGFIHREHRGVFVFSDRAYAEMEGRPAPHPQALHIDTDPLILDRPEGDWDRPGPLDKSVKRGASPLQGREPGRGAKAATVFKETEKAK